MKYIFRGNVVFDYDPETKQMEIPDRWEGKVNAFNFCKFIPTDYLLMSKFFERAYAHTQGDIKTQDLENVEVN